MLHPGRLSRFAVATGTVTFLALTAGVSAAAGPADDAGCLASDVEYHVVASVLVRDTLFGAGDGVYPLGSGTLKLRLQEHAGGEGVKLVNYVLDGQLTVEAKVAFFSTKVVTESRASTGVATCEGHADGTLHGDTLTWTTPVADYRSEGSITCSGNMCGRFGAPPRGRSPIPDAPAAMRFSAFTFSPDRATFTMPYTLVSRSTSPRQSTYLALSGRRVTRACVTATATSC